MNRMDYSTRPLHGQSTQRFNDEDQVLQRMKLLNNAVRDASEAVYCAILAAHGSPEDRAEAVALARRKVTEAAAWRKQRDQKQAGG